MKRRDRVIAAHKREEPDRCSMQISFTPEFTDCLRADLGVDGLQNSAGWGNSCYQAVIIRFPRHATHPCTMGTSKGKTRGRSIGGGHKPAQQSEVKDEARHGLKDGSFMFRRWRKTITH